MTLFTKYRFLRLAFLLVFSACASLFAQQIPVVYEGRVHNLGVGSSPGTTFFWKIFSDPALLKETSVTETEFAGGNQGAVVSVTWKKEGIYYFSATAFGPTGCMNLKIGVLKVVKLNPEAIIAGANVTGACQSVKLDASKSVGDIVKYEWSLVDQGGTLTQLTGLTTEFLLSPAFSGSLPADFRVKLQVTNRVGDTHSDTLAINVDQLPVAEVFSSGKLEKDGSMIVDGTVSTGTAINYKWFTSEGKIVGSDNQPTVKLFGAGIYSLEITDSNGCKSVKSFKFPLEIYQISVADDYARIPWAQDTTITVLGNDKSSIGFVAGSVRILEQPTRGNAKLNTNGSITYTPTGRLAGRDKFVYEVCDAVNLCASATVYIDIYDSGIIVPEGFSPNGDGANEFLVFRGLEHYPKSQLYVFTRAGQPVYRSDDYLNNWDGSTFKSSLTNVILLPTGTYYYVLKLGGTTQILKGFVYIGY